MGSQGQELAGAGAGKDVDICVSLVVPVYNSEHYLEECLDSARAQTLRDIEVICVNDGSTDGSLDIIRRYVEDDPRFRLIDRPNSGYGASLNAGMDAAAGEYVGVLESDDCMHSDALERLYSQAKLFSCDVAKANFNFYWTIPETRTEFSEQTRADMCGRPMRAVDYPGCLCQKPSIWSGVYRLEFLRENKIRLLETPGAAYQDTSFAFKAYALAERIVFLHDAAVDYRQDNEASSVNNEGKVYCVCDEYAEIERFMDSLPGNAPAKGLRAAMYAAKYDAYMWNFVRIAPRFRLDFLRRMSAEFTAAIDAGQFSLDDLRSWKQANLKAILQSPERFMESGDEYADGGSWARARHYLKLGGPKLLFEYALTRASHG